MHCMQSVSICRVLKQKKNIMQGAHSSFSLIPMRQCLPYWRLHAYSELTLKWTALETICQMNCSIIININYLNIQCHILSYTFFSLGASFIHSTASVLTKQVMWMSLKNTGCSSGLWGRPALSFLWTKGKKKVEKKINCYSCLFQSLGTYSPSEWWYKFMSCLQWQPDKWKTKQCHSTDTPKIWCFYMCCWKTRVKNKKTVCRFFLCCISVLPSTEVLQPFIGSGGVGQFFFCAQVTSVRNNLLKQKGLLQTGTI